MVADNASSLASLRSAGHRIVGTRQTGVIKYDLRVRRLPAVEQAFKIGVDADFQMMIDASLAATAAASEPPQPLRRDVNRPVKPHLRRPDVPAIIADQRIRIERWRSRIPSVADASHEWRVF